MKATQLASQVTKRNLKLVHSGLKGGDKLVASEIILKDGRTIPVHWRVRDKKGHLIVDVLVEGISMAITQRDEFSSIISQNGGRVDGLLIALRNRTQR